MNLARTLTTLALVSSSALVVTSAARAQQTGIVSGTVTRAAAPGVRLPNVIVGVAGTTMALTTGPDGRFVFPRVAAGAQTIEFRALGFAPQRIPAQVTAGRTTTVDIAMEALALRLSDVIVSTASRSPERIVEAPAAISVVSPQVIASLAPTGQTPLVLTTVPGVDIVQNGVNDFNVNARGFNSSLTRRVLVLEDGRDVAIAFLGSQEWGAMGTSLDDMSRVEMVRGPGSALYGANAFSGVLTLTSQTAREAEGSRITVAAGELSTRRVDGLHAGLFGKDKFGYKVAAGYSTSDTWARSRTRRDSTDIVTEYEPVTDDSVRKSRESRALIGQSLDGTTLAAVGDRDPVTSIYGTARFDYYAPNGSLGTVEGGMGEARNETFVTGLGRVQVARAQRPWARAAWASDRLNVLTWYTGRDTRDPQWSLSSGSFFLEKSAVVHGEMQYNNFLPRNRGRYIVGVSSRSTHMNTFETLVAPENDDRTDKLYSAYGQLELRLSPRLKLVTASRYDDGTLFEAQFSPKAALVYSPSENSAIRLSVNKAFQTPNYSEFFLYANAAAPTPSPAALETALEGFLATGRAIGTSGLPASLPWNFETATPIIARGNRELEVEKITGYELGYAGAVARNGYLTIDLFWNDKQDFVTDLLPNVNPAFPQYRYDDAGTNVPAYLDAIAARAAALPAGSIPESQRQQ
ncbi:MAG TPA: TonB-dependent receptor, partial [Gemmatimonadaceae bacterium]|nr:TonB-dependent receptor [Gemmatimonadaceae bacterium]